MKLVKVCYLQGAVLQEDNGLLRTELVQRCYVLPLDMFCLIHVDDTKAICIAVACSPGHLPFPAHPCFPPTLPSNLPSVQNILF